MLCFSFSCGFKCTFDEYYDKKVVLFTNYEETFEAYKSALAKAFPEEEVSFLGPICQLKKWN